MIVLSVVLHHIFRIQQIVLSEMRARETVLSQTTSGLPFKLVEAKYIDNLRQLLEFDRCRGVNREGGSFKTLVQRGGANWRWGLIEPFTVGNCVSSPI